jgi:hypothetical protein
MDAPEGEKPLQRTSQKQTSLCCPHLSLFYLPEGLSRHGIRPTPPSQLWSHSECGLGVYFAPSLQAKTGPKVYWGMLYATWE